MSSITATSTNAKAKQVGDDDATIEDVYPAVAYFIVYRETDSCNEKAIYTLLHNQDTDANIHATTTRGNNSCMETTARKLFQVVKDHNNQMMLEMVLASNNFCIASCRTTSAEESEGDGHEPIKRPHYPTSPCRVIVINTNEFDSPLYEAVEKLKSDGLALEIDSWITAQLDGPCLSSNNNELVETVKKK